MICVLDAAGNYIMKDFDLTPYIPNVGSYISMNNTWYREGDPMDVNLSLVNEGPARQAHLYIANPLHMHKVDSLFATHPPMQERINRLLAMAGDRGGSAGPWS